jgi:thioredoxin 1
MTFETRYASPGPSRAEIDAIAEPVVVEFGTPWCGWCRAAQPLIADTFALHPQLRHHKVEDGSGRPLGRSFGVRLWPTLIFMKGGREVTRLVRPHDGATVARAFEAIDPPRA